MILRQIRAGVRRTLIVSSQIPPIPADTPNGTIQLSVATFSIPESAPNGTIFVTRTGGNFGPVTVDISFQNGTAISGTDFEALVEGPTLSWADGENDAKPITINPIDNIIVGPDNKQFTILLSNISGATIGNANCVVTISDDDQASGGGLPGEIPPIYDDLITAGQPVRFVSNELGASDSNDGSQGSPWATVQKALADSPESAVNVVLGDTGDVYEISQKLTAQRFGANYENSWMDNTNGGASATSPWVLTSLVGSLPELRAPASISGGGFGGFGEDHSIIDGFVIGTNNLLNVRGWIVLKNADFTIHRNIRFSGGNFDAVAGGNSNFACIYSDRNEGSLARRGVVFEDFEVIAPAGTGDKNEAGILFYDNHGITCRRFRCEAGSTGQAVFEKVPGKLNLYGQRSFYQHGILVASTDPSPAGQCFTGSTPSNRDSSNFSTIHIEECLLLGGGLNIGGREGSSNQARSESFRLANCTVIDGGLWNSYSQERAGWRNFNDTQAYNNIIVPSPGGSSHSTVWVPSTLGPIPHNQWNRDDQPNYNFYVLPGGEGDFRAFYRIPGVGDDYNETWAEWQAHGYDPDSLIVPSAGFNDEANDDYTLTPSSALKNAGREGGVSSGLPLDPGAFGVSGDWTSTVGVTE